MSRLSYRASLDFILNLERSGIKLGLQSTLDLLERIGNPHLAFDAVHIAGTNGKGSVACFLNSILFHNGAKAGLFTSPHLVDYRERIRVNGVTISRADLAGLVSDLREPIMDIGVSYFEATTVLAFEHFRRQGAAIAAIEVGMGGRLDSTNVITPLASVITSIDFDHTTYLGRTIPKIAGEKAGIIKPGVPVVCGVLRKQASDTIGRIAEGRCSSVFQMGRQASYRPIRMSLDGSTFEYRGLGPRRLLRIRAAGLHQVANAALAVLVAEVLAKSGYRIEDQAIEAGLAHAFWPGRLQVLRKRPLVICDAAHNISGVRLLGRSLKAIGFRGDVAVFGVLRDKDYDKMLALLSGYTDRFVLTKPNSPRALSLARLKVAARDNGIRFKAFGRVDRALEHALDRSGRNGNLLVCGSLYAIGEAMQFFGFKPYLAELCQ
jgi:dihydrofolate synthase/folylpolyglutamate synthase